MLGGVGGRRRRGRQRMRWLDGITDSMDVNLLGGSYGLNSVPPKFIVEALNTPPGPWNMTVFGNRAFKEAIKVNWGRKCGA